MKGKKLYLANKTLEVTDVLHTPSVVYVFRS